MTKRGTVKPSTGTNGEMKVLVQRRREGLGSTPYVKVNVEEYVNEVYECQLEPLPGFPGWHTLMACAQATSPDTTALPIMHKGFFDSHLHVTWMGLKENHVDLSGVRSPDEILSRVREQTETDPENFEAAIIGHGWDDSAMGLTLESLAEKLEGKLPEGRPCVLYRVCGHAGLVNKALRKRASRSDLPGLVTDRELWALHEHIPQPDADTCARGFLAAQKRLLRCGITAVGDMSLDETVVEGLKLVTKRGELQLDVQGVFEGGAAPSVESVGPLHLLCGADSEFLGRAALLSLRHWKKYLDGSLGAHTAWLREAYNDKASFGESLHKTAELVDAATEALSNGFYLSFHAIGDAAFEQVLEVGRICRAKMKSRIDNDRIQGVRPTLHRVEHAQVFSKEQLSALAEQGFWALCVQPGHRVADEHFIKNRLGNTRHFENAYRAGSILAAGVPLALSSDAPIDVFSPQSVLRAAMGHENLGERLSFEDAVWAYTTGSRLSLGLPPGEIAIGSKVFLSERAI